MKLEDSGQVYPRAYGGTTPNRHRRIAVYGLSPRVRGNLTGGHRSRTHCGSIPARTGEPNPANARKDAPPVYPRAYGGTMAVAYSAPHLHGLSPRVRGNLTPAGVEPILKRSIPARTGEP